MILCLGLAADPTFCHTLRALVASGAALEIVDLGQLALSGEVQFRLDSPREGILRLHDHTISLQTCTGVWLRLVDISDAAPTPALATRSGSLYRALSQAFCVPADWRIVNPLGNDRSNFSKFHHAAHLAAISGLPTPASCLTNDERQAQAFLASCSGRAIFKGASSVKTWATRYEPARHDRLLAQLEVCPVLFQECIEGPDARVHVVEDQVFAELIESEQLDYRTAHGNRYQAVTPPAAVAEACRRICRSCRTPFMGIDFKVQARTGEWYLLEANPLPAYEGYDRRANGAISAAVVSYLRRPPE